MLADAKDAKDVRFAGKAIFFQSGSTVQRVLKDGTGKKTVYSSPNLVRAYDDATSMILVEAASDTPDATIRVVKATSGADAEFPEFPEINEGAGGVTPIGGDPNVVTTFNAAGTRVFASDELFFFLLADTNAGDTVLKLRKDVPAVQQQLVTGANVINSPQIVGTELWYVRDQNQVFKVTLPGPNGGEQLGQPAEVFGLNDASCSLAVDATAAYCSVGSGIQRRDLTGANPTTILDEAKSKAQARFGAALGFDGAIYVRSEAPDAKVKHVIRAIKPNTGGADEKLVACGRGLVTDLAVDSEVVVWTEHDAGVFIAAR
jgi:hypothetical protein